MSICYQKANLQPYLPAAGNVTIGGNDMKNDSDCKVTANETANNDGSVTSARAICTSALDPSFRGSSSPSISTSTANCPIKKRCVQDDGSTEIPMSAKHPRLADHSNSTPPPRTIDLNSAQSNFIKDTMEKIRREENLKKGLLLEKVKAAESEYQQLNERLHGGNHTHISQGVENADFVDRNRKEDENASSSKSVSSNTSSASNANSVSVESKGIESRGSARDTNDCVRKHTHHGMNILEELNFHSDVAQIVATAGGLIMYWNEAFFNLCRKPCKTNNPSEKSSTTARSAPPTASTPESPTMSSLTIFELIEPKSLPNLYGMLALALHDVGIVEVDTFPSSTSAEDGSMHSPHRRTKKQGPKPSHLSITLPCKKLPQSKIPCNISIIFMDDLAPMKRCFLGIITPTTPHSSPPPIRSMTSQSDSTDRVRLDGDKHYPTANPTDCQEKVPPPSTMVDRLIHHDEDQANSLGGDNSSNAKKSAFGTMPCGKIVRADDETLCEFLLGSKL